MSDGNPTPLALDGMGSFAGGRRGHGHGHGQDDHLVRLVRNSEDRNPAGTAGGLLGDRSKAYDPTGFGGTTTLVYDEHRRELVRGLRQPQRHGRQLRRRDLVPPPLLAHRRGDRRRPGRGRPQRALRQAPRLPVPDAGRPRPERARGRRPDHRRRPLLARGGGRRPAHRHRLRDRGPGLGRRRRLLPLHAERPRRPDARAACCDMLAIAGQPQVDLREGRTRGERLPVSGCASTTRTPSSTRVGDPRSTFNQGWAKGGAKFNRLEGCWEDDSTIFFVSTSGGDAKNGDVNSDGYARGLRPGLGLPARRTAAGRSRSSTSRRPATRAGLARQPHGHAARRADRVRGRRVVGATSTRTRSRPGSRTSTG